MNKYLFLLLLTTKGLFAQEPVKPVISEDYLSLIRSDSLNKSIAIKTDSIKTGRLKQTYWYRQPVSGLRFKNKQLTIEPVTTEYIEFGGVFSSAFAFSSPNNSPATQSMYAQGRNNTFQGKTEFRGPETGETFSFGPAITELEYDGSHNAYDPNGRLVPAGSGNGLSAQAFDNGILRNGLLQNQALSFRLSQGLGYTKKWNLQLKAGTGREGMIMRANSNSSENVSANFDAAVWKFNFIGAYSAYRTRFSNDNRGGFLNRVYQNSLLTPVSFNNSYGDEQGDGVQRTYSGRSDNPFYLLHNNGHYSRNFQQTGNLSARFKTGRFTLGAGTTLEGLALNSDESLKSGSAFYETGFHLKREKDDRRFTLDGFAELVIKYNNPKYKSTAKLAYTRADLQTEIDYKPLVRNYQYKRKVDEFVGLYETNYDGQNIDGALNLGNKTYRSSTFTNGAYFLPKVDGFIRFENLFNNRRLPLKIAATYNRFYTEVSPSTSYSWYESTSLRPESSFLFLPFKEASGFYQVKPVKNFEFTSRIELFDSHLFQFTASFFTRKSKDEVLPTVERGEIVLKNLAEIRSDGGEVEFTHRTPWSNRFRLSQTLSFYKWTNKVTKVANGYNYAPVAGFSTVNKALVEGKPLGVLVGTTYLRDTKGNLVIDNEGFPIANTSTSEIGNPIPDFTLKLSQNLNLKQWDLNLDWEYKKGGDVWNGTKAFLDYYGRSKSSAEERTISNYVFEGLTADGNVNTKPVSFYDLARPLEQSKFLRYGAGGVASDYIEKADALRLRNVSVTYTLPIKKLAQRVLFTAYAKNIIIWTAYQGVDPDQLMYDQANGQGLDFFNLPSTKNFGVNVSLQF
ncbi:hypothetical protein [Desertivirga arenae]|uniref:hypothetical protein n=1 Tax=Desertivirga arenae TaxID=2810309 RepID=UPI001A95639C|nr:hypothetical protein [Pedobacter sp. SYSU D00823]